MLKYSIKHDQHKLMTSQYVLCIEKTRHKFVNGVVHLPHKFIFFYEY